MGKKIPRRDKRADRPLAPGGVVEWLKYYHSAALAGADAIPDPDSADTINYVLQQRRYWQSVAKGIKWLISHARRDLASRSDG